MSLETGENQSEISRRERAIRTIIYIEDLDREGILGAHSLIRSNPEMPDAPLLEEIDKAVIHEEATKLTEPTFAQRNRIIARRQSRTTAQRLFRPR